MLEDLKLPVTGRPRGRCVKRGKLDIWGEYTMLKLPDDFSLTLQPG